MDDDLQWLSFTYVHFRLGYYICVRIHYESWFMKGALILVGW